MRIDAHQHFWQLARGDYGWLTPALGPIHRDFAPADLAPVLKRHGITRTILVQAAPTIAETEFLLATAAAEPFIAGVVGWVDFTAPDAPGAMERLAENQLLVGLRPMVQDIADPNWLLRSDLAPAISTMIDLGLVFDALVKPRHLPQLLRFIERFPALSIVVDHGGKPDIASGKKDPWRSDLAAVARHAGVTCKLSGLLTEAGPLPDDQAVIGAVHDLLEIFGPERLLWGSDWPVVKLAGDYDHWRKVSLAALAGVSPDLKARILGHNAAELYLSSGRGRA
jgi:L-fuconolactonase